MYFYILERFLVTGNIEMASFRDKLVRRAQVFIPTVKS